MDEVNRHTAALHGTVLSAGVNLLLAAAQIAVGVVARSQALVSDGVHSLSDLASDFTVLFAARHSRKGPDAEHPYGHQRFENGASLALGLLQLAVGAGMLWAALLKFRNPDAIPGVSPGALWIVGLALVAKEMLFRYLLRVARRVRSSLLVANAWHARADAASSLVVAAGLIGNRMGYPVLDPVAALIVGIMVARMGWSFAWDAIHDLMDRAADEEQVAAICHTLRDTPGVAGIHDMRTRKMGDLIIVDVHLEVAAHLSIVAGHDIAVAARSRVMEAHPVLDLMTHIDPVGPHQAEGSYTGPDYDDSRKFVGGAAQGPGINRTR